jgi:hypothetical protein
VAESKPETEIKTMACQEMEARQEEKPTSPDRKPEVAQEDEVPTEDATVMLVGELKKKRHRDRKLAAECRRQKPKTSTREKMNPRKNWLPPAGRCPAVQQWHGAKGTSSRKI